VERTAAVCKHDEVDDCRVWISSFVLRFLDEPHFARHANTPQQLLGHGVQARVGELEQDMRRSRAHAQELLALRQHAEMEAREAKERVQVLAASSSARPASLLWVSLVAKAAFCGVPRPGGPPSAAPVHVCFLYNVLCFLYVVTHVWARLSNELVTQLLGNAVQSAHYAIFMMGTCESVMFWLANDHLPALC
jgi:hypothetical protein